MITSNVRKLMEERGVSILTLAASAGTAKRTIDRARTDAGIAECRLSTLKRIANCLGVSVKDLFEDTEEKND